jgi:hypothetical protein
MPKRAKSVAPADADADAEETAFDVASRAA